MSTDWVQVVRAESTWDDWRVSPVVRQTLQHWAYTLTQRDYDIRLQQLANREK